jgi:hypothetical protein
MKGMRAAAIGAAGLVLASVTVTLATPGDELAACRSKLNGKPQVTIRSDRWVRIGAPKFDAGEGPAQITSFAAMPSRKNGIVVTNGKVIKLSVDAGCTWDTIYSSNGVQAPAPGYTADVFTQLVQSNDQTTWVTSHDDVDGVPHPHVYIGGNVGVAGKVPSFTQTDVGLPTYGRPVSLVAGPAGVDEAYLLVDQLPDPQSGDVSGASRHLYTLTIQSNPPTGAVTGPQWSEVTLPSGFGRVDGMVREYSHKLWIWSGNKYAFASGITGGTPAWTVRTAPGAISAMDVDPYGSVSVIASNGQAQVLYQADSHGRLVTHLSVPGTPYAIAHGTYQDVYVESGTKGTWGYDHIRHEWVDISPRGGPAFHSLTTAQATSSRIVLGMTSSALWRWDTYTQEAFRPPPPGPPTIGNPDVVKLPKSNLTHPVLTPIKRVVSVSPGQVSNVPVTYLVNPDPTPLDVYFLVDTTGSMQPAIRGLQKSVLNIARSLRADLGQSACFGVGGVKDVEPDATSVAAPASSYIFKTFLPVAPCDTAPGLPMVNSALKQLVEGGGGDTPEAQTLALKLAVNGATSAFPPVVPAQPAKFRPGAFKVIVYVSDAGSHEGGGYPTIPEVIQTLNVSDVKVVSIAVQDGAGDFNAAQAMMKQIAIGTGSLAPPSGVDCNGDGGGYYGDLGPNDPLVCAEHLTQDSAAGPIVKIGPAIIGLLLAVKDPGTIEVKVADPHHALRGPIRGQTGGVFDMKYENGLHFTLPVGCTTTQAGQTLPVYLSPYVRSQPRGPAGEVDVQCKLVPAKLPPIPPTVVQAAPLLFVPALRPPVAVAPPIPPNPPAQPASNVNPNAGMAREEQNQPQLAMAAQDSHEAGEDTEVVEMSAMRNPHSQSNAMFLVGAAVLMTAAAGCQLQLRRRTAYVRQGR